MQLKARYTEVIKIKQQRGFQNESLAPKKETDDLFFSPAVRGSNDNWMQRKNGHTDAKCTER